MGFVHLHVHSYYSFLDGASSLDKLLEKAKALNMPALAITDHDRLTGAVRFYEKAKAIGIKPIIGAEVTLESGCHFTLLCKDRAGYSNLCRLLTGAHLTRKGKKSAATRETLTKFQKGIIALSGCSRGELPALIAEGKVELAKEAADFYRETYGADFFTEITRYPSREGMSGSYRLAEFAQEHGIPIVAANNVHYAEVEEYRINELLNAIDQNIPVSQLSGYHTVERYLKSPKEMARLFKDLPQAITTTEEIASRCNLELEIGRLHFPKFDIQKCDSDFSYLSVVAWEGTLKKYDNITPRIRRRLEHELTTIRKLGFCGYFLVVWDIVRWAKERGIRCQARGSAVDSLVVYVLDISTVDPIEHDLLFERFMHDLRREPPDIDLRTKATQRITESLVRVGAFDSFGDRNELLMQIPELMNLKRKVGLRARPLFKEALPEHGFTASNICLDRKSKMLVERELLSLDLSAHPLDFLPYDNGFTKMKDLHSVATGKTVTIVGSVIRYQTPPTRNGNRVVYVIMEDGTGIADVTVFSDVQEKCGEILFREGWLTVRGKVQRRGPKALSIIAEELSPLAELMLYG